MDRKARRIGWTVALAVAVAVTSSALTTYAESRVHPKGSFRIVVSSQNGNVTVPFLATFNGEGGVVATTIPLSCLGPNEVMGPAHGSWIVRLRRGVPTAMFRLWSDVYTTGAGTAASQWEGSIEVAGSAPVTLGEVKGDASFRFPGGANQCGDSLSGPATFVATQLPAEEEKIPTDFAGQ